MNQKKLAEQRKNVTDALAMLLMIIVFCAFMFPFVMVIINSLKQKRDIIKSPFSWLFTIKGLSFDNFVKGIQSDELPECLQELSGCNRNSNRTGYGTRSHAGLLYRA